MKRYITIVFSLFAAIIAMAKAPDLNVEKLFDGSYNTDKSVSIIISKSQDRYFRGFTVNNNPALVKKVTALFKKDTDKAKQSWDIIQDGNTSYSSMEIINNNLEIQIGLSYTNDDSCYLFITGPNEAFK